MQVTTGRSVTRSILLFRLSLAAGIVILLATLSLIWFYHWRDQQDFKQHEISTHARLANSLMQHPQLHVLLKKYTSDIQNQTLTSQKLQPHSFDDNAEPPSVLKDKASDAINTRLIQRHLPLEVVSLAAHTAPSAQEIQNDTEVKTQVKIQSQKATQILTRTSEAQPQTLQVSSSAEVSTSGAISLSSSLDTSALVGHAELLSGTLEPVISSVESSKLELRTLLQQSLIGSPEMSVRLVHHHVPLVSQDPKGLFERLKEASLLQFKTMVAEQLFFAHDQHSYHCSMYPIDQDRQRDPFYLELCSDVSSETQRIDSRAKDVATSAILMEGALIGLLLIIAKKGDQRLVESEKEQMAMESELFFLAHYDAVTHLPNRSLFWERLDSSVSRSARLGKAVGVLVFDLMNAKSISEEFGRSVGDRALTESSRRLQSAARANDLVCRIGPDSFAILLEDMEPERAFDAVSRLAGAVTRQFDEAWDDEGHSFSLQLVGGAALFPRDGSKSEELLAHAQAAQANALSHQKPFEFFGRSSLTV